MASSLLPLDYPRFSFRQVAVESLPGFTEETFKDAALAWRRSANILKTLPFHASLGVGGRRSQWEKVLTSSVNDQEFGHFLQGSFKAYEVTYEGQTKGLFTGYFEPCIKASLLPHPDFPYPIYKRPQELLVIEDLQLFHPALAGYRVAGTVQGQALQPFYKRQELSQGALQGKGYEIAWAQDDIDLYFMHVQGSGKLEFAQGWDRLSYDGTNGYAYTSLGQQMIAHGYLSREEATMERIKAWLRQNPSLKKDLLNQNESFVFFKSLGAQDGPVGRQGSILTPQRSLAVDPRVVAMGLPLWLTADAPPLSQAPLQRFVVAQDVGGAIKGAIRGDFYWGTGEPAGAMAGCMQSWGTLYVLVPYEVEFKGFIA